jgi:hypothetical protein
MPFDAAVYARLPVKKSACLNVGLPAPHIEWPKNLFGNEIGPRDLFAEIAHTPMTRVDRRFVTTVQPMETQSCVYSQS